MKMTASFISFLLKNQIMEQTLTIPLIIYQQLTLHSTEYHIVGIVNNIQHALLINHLLLISKFYIYGGRNTKQLDSDNLKKTIKKSRKLEKEVILTN